MSVTAEAARLRRPVQVLQVALTLVLALGSLTLLVHAHAAAALRTLGLPPGLRFWLGGAELLGVALLWPRRTLVVGAWLLAAVILAAGAIHVAAGQLPFEYVLYLAAIYAVVRLRAGPADPAAAPELRPQADES